MVILYKAREDYMDIKLNERDKFKFKQRLICKWEVVLGFY